MIPTGPRLFLVGPYPPPWGGIAVHLRALLGLARRAGIPAELLDIGEGHAARGGDEAIFDGGSGLRFLAGLVRATRRSDSLHVHIPGSNVKAWVVALAASRSGGGAGRRLLTVHSGLAPGLLERSPTARRAARAAAAGYRRVLCTNASIASALGACGVPRAKLLVVSPFLAPHLGQASIPPAARAARARCSALLACALAPGPQYGERILLEALRLLSARRPGLGCLAFGPGTADPAFRRSLARHGLERVVIPLGTLDHDVSLATIAGCDLFVRPTLADGDSLSIREALSMGRRVVASDAAPRPTDVVIFRSGDPAQLARRIEESLSQPAPRRRVVEAGGEAPILAAWSEIGLSAAGGAIS